MESEEAENDDVKNEISTAYDKVGATANISGTLIISSIDLTILKNIHEWIILKPGDAELARKVMKRLGYSQDQIYTAGEDVFNYQGVGCPHTHAAISSGQCLHKW